jgi:hypothetical protein
MSDPIKYEGPALEAIKQVLPEVDFSKIEGDVTLDAINAQKGEVLITREVHKRELSSTVGRITGAGKTVFSRILGESAKGKDYDELLPLLESKYTEVNDRITELEKATPGSLTDKEKKELTELRKLSDEQKSALAAKEEEIETVRKSAKEEAETERLNHSLDREFESVKWVDDVSPFAKKGLRMEMESKYSFKREGDKILVFTKAGEIVRNSAATGQMEAKELFEKEAKEAKLYKVNGAQAPGTGTPPPSGKNLTPEQVKRQQKVNEYADKMKK